MPIVGSAVATMVWSSAASSMASMMPMMIWRMSALPSAGGAGGR